MASLNLTGASVERDVSGARQLQGVVGPSQTPSYPGKSTKESHRTWKWSAHSSCLTFDMSSGCRQRSLPEASARWKGYTSVRSWTQQFAAIANGRSW